MATLESIDQKLKAAAKSLDDAAKEISKLPLEPHREHIRSIGEVLVKIFDIQNEIYRKRPDLKPDFFCRNNQSPEG